MFFRAHCLLLTINYMKIIVKKPENLLYKQIVNSLKTKSEEELKFICK
jgi:hypothetical protein